LSTLPLLQSFEMFHLTQDASAEIDDWMSTVVARRPELTAEEAEYTRELTALAAMEYAAFFHLVERTLTFVDRALQVDERAARAAAARCDSPPTECYGMLRFVRGEARMDDLFLFTSDLQKVEGTGIVKINTVVKGNDLDAFARTVEAYARMFEGTWIGEERVVMTRIPAIWFARWCINGSPDLRAAELNLRASLERFPELFGLLAPAQ
jgi:hypothetical protein